MKLKTFIQITIEYDLDEFQNPWGIRDWVRDVLHNANLDDPDNHLEITVDEVPFEDS